MDKLNKLHALMPETQVSSAGNGWTHKSPKPKHLYEGTDSEDDEEIVRQGREMHQQMDGSSWARPPTVGTEAFACDQGASTRTYHHLEMGQLAVGGEPFCPWKEITNYPSFYIGKANKRKVEERFWDNGKLLDRTWDFFYIRRMVSAANTTPVILVPTEQVEAFFATINQTLKIQLTIPSGNRSFDVTFESDGTPQPRYLGRSTSQLMACNLHNAVPPHFFKHHTETSIMAPAPTDRSVAAFKAKIELLAKAQRGKKQVNAEKKKVERVAKQQSWSHSTKRVQRYLGLRRANDGEQKEIAQAEIGAANPDLQWGTAYNDAVNAARPRSANFDAARPAPYDQEGDVVFICVDIEANERNSKQITEIGIATLDIRDLKGMTAGERGVNWLSQIRARHFRINQYKYIRNTEFVSGCPDRFEFGDSEFVDLKDAPRAVASCFKYPFSGPEELLAPTDDNARKRNIIFVGHGVRSDIEYLQSMGYDIHNLSNLQEIIDTTAMWQGLTRDPNPRNLGSVLAELDIAGWNLHNAGNDAVYTLQAMVGISIRQLTERQKRQHDKEQEKQARVEEAVKEATLNAVDREDGWSSGGDNSDGGAPVMPIAPGTKKEPIQLPKKGSHYQEGPWRNQAQNPIMDSHLQGKHGSWGPGASNNLLGQLQQNASTQGYRGPGTAPSNSRGQAQQKAVSPAPRHWPQDPTLPSTAPKHTAQRSAADEKIQGLVTMVEGFHYNAAD